MARPWRRSSRHPGRPRQYRAIARVVKATANGDPIMKLPLDGSPSARSMTLCDHRSTSHHSPLSTLGVDHREGQPHRQRRIADRLDEGHGFRCQPRRLADPAPPRVIHHQPAPCPMASDALSPAAVHNSRNSSKRSPATFTWTRQAIPHNMVRGRDAHGCPVGVIGRHCVGDRLGALPTQSRRGDVAVGRPRCGAHMPAVGGVQITGGLQVFGNQGRILISRCRVT